MNSRTHGTSAARRTVAMAAGALVAFLAWNVVTGLLLVKPVGTRPDATFVRTSKPGTYIQGLEGYSISAINAEGLRGVDAALLPASARRILFLGDSFTEAFQVPAAEAFPAVTAALLSTDASEVVGINAGRSGAGPADYVMTAGWCERTYHPDAVVVQFGDSDFVPSAYDAGQPFYAKDAPGGISFERNEDFQGRSALLDALPAPALALRAALELPVLRLSADNLGKRLRPAQAQAAEEKAAGPLADQALIEAVVGELRRAFPHLVVVYVPQATAGRALEATPGPVERAVADVCRKHGVTYVEGRGALSAYQADTGCSGYGFNNTTPGTGHLNADGHLALAAELADAVGEELGR